MDASLFAQKLPRNFMGMYLYFSPKLERWQLVRRVVTLSRRNPIIGIVLNRDGDPEVKDHLWPVLTCRAPNGGYRDPNENDLRELYQGDLHRVSAKQRVQEMEDAEERHDQQKERDEREWQADAEKDTVGRLKTAHNVPNVQAGIAFDKQGKVVVGAS